MRLVSPLPDGMLSNDPTVTTNPPLTTLFDTLGNPTTNQSGSTDPASACNMSDAVSAANGAPSFPSLASGAGGTLWILTRGIDSSGLGYEIGNPGPLLEGGRYLIELSPQQGDPCPAPSGTFTIAPAGGSPRPASTSSGPTVTLNSNFDFIWPLPTDTHQYQQPGLFTVTLTMLGDFGTYVETGTIDVTPGVLPEAAFTNSTAGMTVNVNASASTPSPGRRLIVYQWNWGDGQIDDSPTPTDSHTYAQPGTYTVTLTVLDSGYAHSPTPATAAVSVTAPPSPPPASGPAPRAASPPPAPGRPVVTALVRSRKTVLGRVRLVLSCPTGQVICRGTVVLRTMKSIPGHGRHGKRTRRVVSRVTFAIPGGKSKPVWIRLCREAVALLAKSRLLWTTVTVSAGNPQGERYASTFRLALLPAGRLPGGRAGGQRSPSR